VIAFGGFLLLGGRAADLLGRRRVFMAGLTLFTAASLVCGLSTSLGMLIAGRIAQGIGAALCVPSSLALLNSSFPDAASRARAVGIWAGAGGLGLAAGPVVGGIVVDQFGWPTIFFLNLPFGLIGLWLTIVHAPSGSKIPDRGLDLIGQALAIVALAGLTFGFIESGELGWTSPAVLAGFACFIVAAISFLVAEARSADPMLPLSLFATPAVGAACLVGLLSNFAYYGLMFVLSLYFQGVKGFSPLATGLAFLPMTALVTVASLVAGRLTARFGPRLPMAIGQALAGCGYLALAGLADAATPYIILVGPMLAAGIGVALTVPSMTTAVLANVQRQHGGVASGALNAARQIGGVIGVGVFGSLVAGGSGDLPSGMHVALLIAGLALMIGCLVSIAGVRRSRAQESCSSPIAAQACE